MGITINGKSETGVALMGFKEILRTVATKLPRATKLPEAKYLGKPLAPGESFEKIVRQYLQ